MQFTETFSTIFYFLVTAENYNSTSQPSEFFGKQMSFWKLKEGDNSVMKYGLMRIYIVFSYC